MEAFFYGPAFYMPSEIRPLRITRESAASDGVTRTASMLIILSVTLALLFLGREVLEPLAIAVLLSFVLAPGIRLLRQWHLGRTASVFIAAGALVAAFVSLGILIETQLTQLADAIPRYQDNLVKKVGSVNRALLPSGALERASSTLNSLAGELKVPGAGNGHGGNAAANVQPIPVEVQTAQPATLEYLRNIISPLIDPLIMGGLLFLFLIFILFYREDLRDRILRLAGKSDLHRSTEAMNEAGERLSRYFLVQTSINITFGCVIGTALWAIGIPNALLWGIISALLRFIPYVGTPLAAIFPLALACAIEPGWTAVFLVAALYFVSEFVTGQAIEPVLQGQHTGLSPIAIVLCQLFWTLIWGAPGLLLAVPITVCLAVLGKHVESLSFLAVILGDEPALAPHEALYQRILAGDTIEAAYQAEQDLGDGPRSAYYDDVALKALALAQKDSMRGRLSLEAQTAFAQSVEEIVNDLSDQPASKTDVSGEEAASSDVILVPARTPIDQAACFLLADLLTQRGLRADIVSLGAERKLRLRPDRASPLIVLSAFGLAASDPAARFMVRRLRRLFPNSRLVLGAWFPGEPGVGFEPLKALGVTAAATTLTEASNLCFEHAAEFEPAVSPQAGQAKKSDALAASV